MDRFLDNALAADASNTLAEHLASCGNCARELEARRSLRGRLKSAVHSLETPVYLEARVRAHLQASRKPSSWILNLAAVAAGLVIFAVAISAYHYGDMRWTRDSQEAYIRSVSSRVTSLMRVGLGDHVHCAVFRKYPKNPPSISEFAAEMGPQYSGIIPIVRERVPDDFRLLLAHRCTYHNRRFVHVVLRSDSALLSVVITRKKAGEALGADEVVPKLSEAGVSIYESSVQRFQIAAFESRDHMLYVISDMPGQQNTELMQAMAPALKTFLGKLES
jgi:hypothetical protein